MQPRKYSNDDFVYRTCLDNVCSCGSRPEGTQCECPTIQAFQHECQKLGVRVKLPKTVCAAKKKSKKSAKKTTKSKENNDKDSSSIMDIVNKIQKTKFDSKIDESKTVDGKKTVPKKAEAKSRTKTASKTKRKSQHKRRHANKLKKSGSKKDKSSQDQTATDVTDIEKIKAELTKKHARKPAADKVKKPLSPDDLLFG